MSTINELIPNWKNIIEKNKNKISKNYCDLIPILQQLVKDRNSKEIRYFYDNITLEPLDINEDRNPDIYNFIMQFANMKSADCFDYDKKEYKTSKHYLCFKTIYHRDELDEFSMLTFFSKKQLAEEECRYQSFLMMNNLVGMETFLYTYEFSKPIFDKKYEVQCNNIVLTMKWENTEMANCVDIVRQNNDWKNFLLPKLKKLDLSYRTALVNGTDFILIFDLYQFIWLQHKGIRYILEKTEKEFMNSFLEFNVYDNNHFFMVPGSVNVKRTKKWELSHFNYRTKRFEKDGIYPLEYSFYRCFFVNNMDSSNPPLYLTNVASNFGLTVQNKKSKYYIENKKRFTRVGKERLLDLDYYLQLRNYRISNRFVFFKILGNVLFYLGKSENEILKYMQERNNQLMNSISEFYLLQIFIFCLKDYQNYLKNPKNGIKYKNTKIVELLGISKTEQYSMKQLMDKEEVYERKKNYDAEYRKSTYKRKKNITIDEELIKSLFEQKLSWKELQSVTGLSYRKLRELKQKFLN